MQRGAKNPNAGRKKGTPNKDTRTLQEKAAALGCDPFEVLIYFAKGDWEALGYKNSERVVSTSENGVTTAPVISAELRQKSAKDACEYLYPKRKAVEVSGPDGGDPFKTFAQLVAGVAESGNGK